MPENLAGMFECTDCEGLTDNLCEGCGIVLCEECAAFGCLECGWMDVLARVEYDEANDRA